MQCSPVKFLIMKPKHRKKKCHGNRNMETSDFTSFRKNNESLAGARLRGKNQKLKADKFKMKIN